MSSCNPTSSFSNGFFAVPSEHPGTGQEGMPSSSRLPTASDEAYRMLSLHSPHLTPGRVSRTNVPAYVSTGYDPSAYTANRAYCNTQGSSSPVTSHPPATEQGVISSSSDLLPDLDEIGHILPLDFPFTPGRVSHMDVPVHASTGYDPSVHTTNDTYGNTQSSSSSVPSRPPATEQEGVSSSSGLLPDSDEILHILSLDFPHLTSGQVSCTDLPAHASTGCAPSAHTMNHTHCDTQSSSSSVPSRPPAIKQGAVSFSSGLLPSQEVHTAHDNNSTFSSLASPNLGWVSHPNASGYESTVRNTPGNACYGTQGSGIAVGGENPLPPSYMRSGITQGPSSSGIHAPPLSMLHATASTSQQQGPWTVPTVSAPKKRRSSVKEELTYDRKRAFCIAMAIGITPHLVQKVFCDMTRRNIEKVVQLGCYERETLSCFFAKQPPTATGGGPYKSNNKAAIRALCAYAHALRTQPFPREVSEPVRIHLEQIANKLAVYYKENETVDLSRAHCAPHPGNHIVQPVCPDTPLQDLASRSETKYYMRVGEEGKDELIERVNQHNEDILFVSFKTGISVSTIRKHRAKRKRERKPDDAREQALRGQQDKSNPDFAEQAFSTYCSEGPVIHDETQNTTTLSPVHPTLEQVTGYIDSQDAFRKTFPTFINERASSSSVPDHEHVASNSPSDDACSDGEATNVKDQQQATIKAKRIRIAHSIAEGNISIQEGAQQLQIGPRQMQRIMNSFTRKGEEGIILLRGWKKQRKPKLCFEQVFAAPFPALYAPSGRRSRAPSISTSVPGPSVKESYVPPHNRQNVPFAAVAESNKDPLASSFGSDHASHIDLGAPSLFLNRGTATGSVALPAVATTSFSLPDWPGAGHPVANAPFSPGSAMPVSYSIPPFTSAHSSHTSFPLPDWPEAGNPVANAPFLAGSATPVSFSIPPFTSAPSSHTSFPPPGWPGDSSPVANRPFPAGNATPVSYSIPSFTSAHSSHSPFSLPDWPGDSNPVANGTFPAGGATPVSYSMPPFTSAHSFH